MGRLHIILDDKVEEKFRKNLGKQGLKKGAISRKVEELIIEDIENGKKNMVS